MRFGKIGATQMMYHWKNPYPVMDSCVAWWDGEWNAGGGKHDGSATRWVDLSGNGYDAFCGSVPPIWGDKYSEIGASTTQTGDTYRKSVWLSSATYSQLYPLLSGNGYTLDFVGYVTSGRQYLNVSLLSFNNTFIRGTWYGESISYAYNNGGASYPCWNGKYTSGTTVGTDTILNYGASSDVANKIFHYAVVSDFVNAETRCYRDGGLVGTYAFAQISGNAFTRWMCSPLQGLFPGNRAYKAVIHSRALTASEIAANYAVDKLRFNLP